MSFRNSDNEYDDMVEQFVERLGNANNAIKSLIETIKSFEHILASMENAESRDKGLRIGYQLEKADDEISDLKRNMQALAYELEDTGSKIRRAD